MYPPIYVVCMTNPGVQALLGDRLYPFGEAEQGVRRPYVVWQVIYGAPENYLNQTPDTDHFGTQIDIYAATVDSARAVAAALFAAIEPVAYVVAYNGESREEDTRDYRYSFTVDWIKHRP